MSRELPREPVGEEHRHAARHAVESAHYLRNEEAVRSMGATCDASHAVGLDTEFVRERTFHARPGLIQISDGREVWLLDAVEVPRSDALGELLADPATTKVLHSVGEDLEILEAVGGRWPAPLFDTQVAAALLGQPLQLRYEHLVKAVLGVDLEGGKARNDWCRRPLSPALLQYAAEDVIWLPLLKERLEALLERAGRLHWHREDCARIVERARAGDVTPPLSRVKGAGRLDTPAVARLDALAGWRDEVARERDLPRRFVMSDESLVDLARAGERNGVERVLGQLPGGQRKRYGPAIAELLERTSVAGFERPDWLDPLTPEQRDRLREAQQSVRTLAEELGIEPAVIASKKELTRLIRGERPEWLDGWRGDVLAGRLEGASVSISAP